MRDGNEAYIRANLGPETYYTSQLNLICMCDADGRIRWSEARDWRKKEVMSLAAFAGPSLDRKSPLVQFRDPSSHVKGILLTDRGPLLVVSLPVLTTSSQGPIAGACIMGRLLDEDAVTDLVRRTQTRLMVWSIGYGGAEALSAADREILSAITSAKPVLLRQQGDAALLAYTTFPDLYDKPALLLRAETPRTITAEGRASMRFARVSNVAAMSAIMVLVRALLEWIVVRPVARLTRHAVRVGQEDDLNARLAISRSDEIGTLAREFDGMVRRLAESRARLLETAHRAGMAEVAANLLHNVGNAITSIGVMAEALMDRVRQSKVSGLSRATAMLDEHCGEIDTFLARDERGRKLLNYLPQVSAVPVEEQQAVTQQLRDLQAKVQHIKDIIESQHAIAAGPRFAKEEDLEAILREVLNLHDALLHRHKIDARLAVSAPLPRTVTNKVKLLQVLDNLIRNAVDALADRPAGERRLTIAASLTSSDMLRVDVVDNGCGFDPRARENLFTAGHSTKPRGQGLGFTTARMR